MEPIISRITFSFIVESAALCSENDIIDKKPVLIITFDDGNKFPRGLNKTSLGHDFSTNHDQTFEAIVSKGMFGFFNTTPDFYDSWYSGASDHTANDLYGYMMIVHVAESDALIFNYTIKNLCIGVHYEFSAYLANIAQEDLGSPKPNVRFEVREAVKDGKILSQACTGDIPECDKLTWSKYGVLFEAKNVSVVLLMFSNDDHGQGFPLAIDDIKLSVCSRLFSGFCPSG